MFEISCLFKHGLLFILKNMFKLAIDAISKNLIIYKIFLKKILEFFLHY